MKKKGFTLIELLAVIVILSLIVIIAVPKILDVIEKSERTAWGESAGLMAKAAELKYSEGNLTNTERNETYEFENGDFKSGSPTLTFKGDKPYSGKIVQEKGKTTLALISKNKKWCAIKKTGERIAKVYKIGKEIKEEDCKIEYTGSSDDDKPEVYTCPDVSTYPGKDLTGTADSNGNIKVDGYTFSISNNEATIISYDGESGENVDLVIPKTINNTPITTIGTASLGGVFKDIIISPNIKLINSNAFSRNGGTTANKVDFSYASSLSELGGFENTKLNKGIVLNKCSNNLTTLSPTAFHTATMPSLTINGIENLTIIKDDAFEHITTDTITIENLPKLTTIESQLSLNVKHLILKDLPSLTEISDFTQSLNITEELTLQNLNSLKEIKPYTFQAIGTDVENSVVKITLDNLPALETIGYTSFTGLKSVDTEIILKNLPKLISIGDSAFSSRKIKSLKMDNLQKLETIGLYAFKGSNDAIGELSKYDYDLPSLKTIGTDAFTGNNIKTADLSKSPNLTSISDIFDPLIIKSINVSGTKITTLNLSGYSALTNINIDNCKELTSINFTGLSNLETLNVKKSQNLESIECYSCEKITKLDTSGLTKLTKIYMPGCQAITTVRISESVPAGTDNSHLYITSKLACVQIDGDQTRFNANFQTYFPQVDSTVIKSSCNFD